MSHCITPTYFAPLKFSQNFLTYGSVIILVSHAHVADVASLQNVGSDLPISNLPQNNCAKVDENLLANGQQGQLQ